MSHLDFIFAGITLVAFKYFFALKMLQLYLDETEPYVLFYRYYCPLLFFSPSKKINQKKKRNDGNLNKVIYTVPYHP